jgi:hypothetical protein
MMTVNFTVIVCVSETVRASKAHRSILFGVGFAVPVPLAYTLLTRAAVYTPSRRPRRRCNAFAIDIPSRVLNRPGLSVHVPAIRQGVAALKGETYLSRCE